MNKFKAKITWIAPLDLVPYAQNTKKHTPHQIDKVAGSIAKFGFGQPIQVDKKNGIITGHCRREAALKLGLTQVPCIVRADLKKNEIKALRIADNKLAESPWDNEMLELELNSLNDDDFQEFDLLGFAPDELSEFILKDMSSEQQQETQYEQELDPLPKASDSQSVCPSCKRPY